MKSILFTKKEKIKCMVYSDDTSSLYKTYSDDMSSLYPKLGRQIFPTTRSGHIFRAIQRRYKEYSDDVSLLNPNIGREFFPRTWGAKF